MTIENLNRKKSYGSTQSSPEREARFEQRVIPLRPGVFPEINGTEHDRLFESADTLMAFADEGLWAIDVYAMTRTPDVQQHFDQLKSNFRSLSLCDSLQTTLNCGRFCEAYSSLLAIDIDEISPVTSIVSELLTIRNANPSLPILIMSRQFARNDFSLERRMIADASLRLPTTAALLLEALGTSLNNARDRMKNG